MKNIIKNILVLILLTGLIACQQAPKQTKESSVSELNKLLTNITIDALKEQNYVQAQRSITALILSDDDKVWKFIQSAIISLPKEKSMELLEKALTNDSVNNSSSQLFSLAKVYISYKDTDSALSTINKSIALDKNNLEARYWRARLLTIMKDFDNAEKDFSYITKKDPKNQDYSGQYAAFFQETSQFDKAQDILAKLDVNADVLFKRIVFAMQNKNMELAEELYNDLKILEVDSKKENHKLFLTAEAAYWLKKLDDSERFYNQVSGGNHYLDSREMLSMIFFEKERYDEAIELLHQLQNAEENYAVKAYRLESQIYKKQGDTREAILTLTRSLQILSDNPDLLYERAMLYESQGKMKKLEKDLLQIIKDDPEHFEALNALGYSLADHDLKLEEAHEYIKKALSFSPDNAAILDSLGWVQFKLGQYTEAEKNFKKALSQDINDPELYIHLYKTLIKLERTTEAKDLLSKAKNLFPDNEKLKAID